MHHRNRLLAQLKHARQLTEALFASFTKPSDWTHQVHPKANHALWVAGHMGTVDNFFISLLDKSQVRSLPGYDKLFGMGSIPTSDPADYPNPDEVLAYMRERRETLLEIMSGISDEGMEASTGDGAPDFIPDVAAVFETAIWHEGMHAGQVTVARRGLGHDPLLTSS